MFFCTFFGQHDLKIDSIIKPGQNHHEGKNFDPQNGCVNFLQPLLSNIGGIKLSYPMDMDGEKIILFFSNYLIPKYYKVIR